MFVVFSVFIFCCILAGGFTRGLLQVSSGILHDTSKSHHANKKLMMLEEKKEIGVF